MYIKAARDFLLSRAVSLTERNLKVAPKIKFTKEKMIEAAIRVVREKGADALTAKSLSEELGISTQPVFTCFGTMDVLKAEVYAAAEEMFYSFVEEGLKDEIPFFGFGKQYVRFAQEEVEIYRMLLFAPPTKEITGAERAMTHCRDIVRPSLMEIYHLTEAEANRFFRDLWLVAHSIATLIVTGGCPYSYHEIGQIMTGFSAGMLMAIKNIPNFTDGEFDRDKLFRSIIAKKVL